MHRTWMLKQQQPRSIIGRYSLLSLSSSLSLSPSLSVKYNQHHHLLYSSTTKNNHQQQYRFVSQYNKQQQQSFIFINRRNMSDIQFPVKASMTKKLTETFQPIYLDVINESHMHNVPMNSETHFKVVIVSTQFDSMKSPIQRHRLIHSTIKDELDGPVHALSIVAKTPKQWELMKEKQQDNNNESLIPSSPACRGGDGSLPPKN